MGKVQIGDTGHGDGFASLDGRTLSGGEALEVRLNNKEWLQFILYSYREGEPGVSAGELVGSIALAKTAEVMEISIPLSAELRWSADEAEPIRSHKEATTETQSESIDLDFDIDEGDEVSDEGEGEFGKAPTTLINEYREMEFDGSGFKEVTTGVTFANPETNENAIANQIKESTSGEFLDLGSLRCEIDGDIFRLMGKLDQHADLRKLIKRLERPVMFDLFDVKTVDSAGSQAWSVFAKNVAHLGPHQLVRCSVPFVTQMNRVPGMLVACEVGSVMLPFICAECGQGRDVEFMTLDRDAMLPSALCGHCEGMMGLHGSEPQFLGFFRG